MLSGGLRSKGLKWRRVGSGGGGGANDRLEWPARSLEATFVDPES